MQAGEAFVLLLAPRFRESLDGLDLIFELQGFLVALNESIDLFENAETLRRLAASEVGYKLSRSLLEKLLSGLKGLFDLKALFRSQSLRLRWARCFQAGRCEGSKKE